MVALLCAMAVAGCGSTDLPDPVDLLDPGQVPEEALTLEGTVEFVPVEGGCWSIVTGDRRYEPIGLPEAYERDGLQVRALVLPRDDLASICQIGQIVELLRIEPRRE